ncbi:hypothetical protein AJ80_02351 [Polytolypa hystricis UAMH7299]|uniref:Phosphoglycerate mutase n=1 Tax=Polytolypa hystricis (strain UAMH7299) TaxID=1447883 RepID=A0A2B7YR85_POLH7|nr:hypothetical protein AJ80_02351 [Polytolypa hystricis UAMH7299]
MGKAPAVIFVARHGARLDAVDKQWHLTSPTPYDPPLTYGGWNQSRTLGARIGSLIQARDTNPSSDDNADGSPNVDIASGKGSEEAVGLKEDVPATKTNKKYKIIIHSSPFLRCVQTAIAVGAGVSNSLQEISPRIPSSKRRSSTNNGLGSRDVQKCNLRLDAFLGEWLSPDYFEQITPPPGSVMMVASAKADLLRPAEQIETGVEAGGKAYFGNFPGGWTSPVVGSPRSPNDDDDGPFKNISSMSQALAGSRNRAGSYDTGSNTAYKHNDRKISRIITDLPLDHEGYMAPTPTYAVSPADPIPTGYVSHARDSCVDVDYQWDSMREPQNWGDGGEYGEEWSSMHDRFQRGLKRMVEWYKSQPPDAKTATNGDDDVETVLILITHGAGCNALIGGVTGQPVLLDVGTSSLTMAIRNDAPAEHSTGTGTRREYKVKLAASTDHLRPGANPRQLPQMQSPDSLPSPIPSYRQRFNSTASSINSPRDTFSIGDATLKRFTHRMSSTGSRSMSYARSSSGLWGSGSTLSDTNSDSADDLIPNFGDPLPPTSHDASNSTAKGGSKYELESGNADAGSRQTPERTGSQSGLWSSGGDGGSTPQGKEATKRRWTVTERNG